MAEVSLRLYPTSKLTINPNRYSSIPVDEDIAVEPPVSSITRITLDDIYEENERRAVYHFAWGYSGYAVYNDEDNPYFYNNRMEYKIEPLYVIPEDDIISSIETADYELSDVSDEDSTKHDKDDGADYTVDDIVSDALDESDMDISELIDMIDEMSDSEAEGNGSEVQKNNTTTVFINHL